jgi:hypothetical protein
MTMTRSSAYRLLLAGGAGLMAMALAGQASARCSGAGVITRIDGDPGAVHIRHADGDQVDRPRVLEVVCAGDLVTVNGARVTLSLDGRGTVQVTSSYQVAARSGSPTLADNAYGAMKDQVVPDMKRLPWDVRLKGPDDPLDFALPTMAQGSQKLPAGEHNLLFRMVGGNGPYTATLAGASGPITVTSSTNEIVFPNASLPPGRYTVAVKDASGESVTGQFSVVNPAQPVPDTYRELSDPEVRAAATAASMARGAPTTRSFEAEQLLYNAPANGLDRERVFDLIESYGE